MLIKSLASIILSLLVCTALAGNSSELVVELSDKDFDKVVGEANTGITWILEFYAPWCGACARFQPEYLEFAQKMSKKNPNVRVGKINVEESYGLATRFFVTRLPTVFHVKGQKVRTLDLSADRTSDSLVKMTEEGWKDIKPMNAWLGPFSLVGKSVGIMGRLTNSFASFSRKVTSKVSSTTLIVISALGFLLPIIWMVIQYRAEQRTAAASRPIARVPSSPNQSEQVRRRRVGRAD